MTKILSDDDLDEMEPPAEWTDTERRLVESHKEVNKVVAGLTTSEEELRRERDEEREELADWLANEAFPDLNTVSLALAHIEKKGELLAANERIAELERQLQRESDLVNACEDLTLERDEARKRLTDCEEKLGKTLREVERLKTRIPHPEQIRATHDEIRRETLPLRTAAQAVVDASQARSLGRQMPLTAEELNALFATIEALSDALGSSEE